jgi:hypothetical protein
MLSLGSHSITAFVKKVDLIMMSALSQLVRHI